MSLLLLTTRPRFLIGTGPQSRARQSISLTGSSVTSSRIAQTRPNSITSRYLSVSQKHIRFSTTSSSAAYRAGSQNNVGKFFNRDMAMAGGDAASHAAKTTGVNSQSAQRWARIAWWVRVTRIPVLIGSLYSLGYQQGVLDSVRNPSKIQQVRGFC